MKPTKAWVIVDPNGKMMMGSLCRFRFTCVQGFLRHGSMVGEPIVWKSYAAQGYRCEQVVITKVKARTKKL